MFRQQRFGDVNNTQSLVESNSSGQIFDRCQELSAIAGRLDEIDAQHGDSETPPPEFDELCLRRRQLVREIVDAPAPTIRESVLKTTVISSLLSDGELRLGLTRSCAADCERALGDEGEGEQGLEALEPLLWAACQRVREELAAAPADDEAVRESWLAQLREAILAIAGHQAATSLGLKAKGEIFHELWRVADETEALGALQMSYLSDFRALASARLSDEPLRQRRP